MLQELNVAEHGHKPEWMAKFDEEKRKASFHVEFRFFLYREQPRQGRHFLAMVGQIMGSPVCSGNDQSSIR